MGDFGLSRLLNSIDKMSAAGTFTHMAPEIWDCKKGYIDPFKGDVYRYTQ